MKTTQYVRQEKAIAAADRGGIYERWHWGLRLLRDPEKMSSEKSLKHGVTESMVAAAEKAGLKLSTQEIQRRIRCARAYKTEAQIREALTHFDSWDDLARAGFPASEADPDGPLADHRTDAERRRDHARALAEQIGDQGALFPLSDFEPIVTTVEDLRKHARDMADMTARFAERDRQRFEYLDKLTQACEGDEAVTWAEAHRRAYELGLVDSPDADDEDTPLDGEAS